MLENEIESLHKALTMNKNHLDKFLSEGSSLEKADQEGSHMTLKMVSRSKLCDEGKIKKMKAILGFKIRAGHSIEGICQNVVDQFAGSCLHYLKMPSLSTHE